MKRTLDSYLRNMPKARRDKIDARAAEIIKEEMSLQELRKAMQQSQQELASKLNVKQAEISKMERRTDMYVSTLRNYVQAMGGSLEIVATFPNLSPVHINQFEEIDQA